MDAYYDDDDVMTESGSNDTNESSSGSFNGTRTIGSFKMQRYRGIPRLMFLTRLKTYEKYVETRKNIFFRSCRPAPGVTK